MQRTSVSLVTQASSPFLTNAVYACPAASVALSRFEGSGRHRAPCRVSLQGCILEVGELEETMSGNAKRNLTSVDELGYWLTCTAVGDNAEHPGLVERNQVVLYFTHVRPPSSTSATPVGSMFLFQSSCIVALGQCQNMARQREEVIISG